MSQVIFGLKLTTRLWIMSLLLSILFGFSLWLIKVNHNELFFKYPPIFYVFLTLVGTFIVLVGIILIQKIIEKISVKHHATHELIDDQNEKWDTRFTEIPIVVYIPTEIPNVFYLEPASKFQDSYNSLPSYEEVLLHTNKKNIEFQSYEISKHFEIDVTTPPPSYDEVIFATSVTQN